MLDKDQLKRQIDRQSDSADDLAGQARNSNNGGKSFTVPSIWKTLIFALLIVGLIIFIWNPLSEDANRQVYFEKKISEMISGKDEAIVKISDLTNFKWEKVYFKYIILPKIKVGVIVKFYAGTDVTIMDLPFPKYYIEEPYIKGSLDRKWLNYGDSILIKASTHIRSRSIILSEPSN